jgi:GxxExxY protein
MGSHWCQSWDLYRWKSQQIKQIKRIFVAQMSMQRESGIADRVKREYGDLTCRIIGAAMAVYNALGPGFPEKLYQKGLAIELNRRGIKFEREKLIEIFYGAVKLRDFYLDFLIENCVVLEIKAIEQLLPLHQQQIISYLTASGREVGLLVNFGAASLTHKRILPPLAVQHSETYQDRLRAWKHQM